MMTEPPPESEDAKVTRPDSTAAVSLPSACTNTDHACERNDDAEIDLEEKTRRAQTVKAFQDFNISPDESDSLNYEFGFPDYLSNDDSASGRDNCLLSAVSDDDELGSTDDSLLDLVCNYHLDEGEKNAPDIHDRGDLQIDNPRINNEDEHVYFIPPPPEAVDRSHDAEEAALHAWTLKHNHNVSRWRARYLHGTKTIWARNYECDRAGNPSARSIY